MEVNIHLPGGCSGLKMQGVVCPECGYGGGSSYPCWCSHCHDKGEKVLMLPSVNKFTYVSNWCESVKKQRG
jgi:hypothetical protein